MRRILADVNRCSGCRLCEMECSFSKEGAFASSTSRITIKKEDKLGLDLPIVCWHCNPCVAMENCPEGALERDKEGHIYLKEEKCIGCNKCSETCIIGAIKLHPEKKIPQICDQCRGEPLCVQKCPTKALTYTEIGEQKPKLPNQVVKEILRRWGVSA